MKLEQHDVKTILAPMEGVNCEAFLQMCSQLGCDMVETQAIEHVEDNFYNLEVLKNISCPVSFQIMTNNVETAVELAQHVEPYVDSIDLNFGCPLKDKLGQKMGGYLLQFPHLMEKIIAGVMQSVSIPVTVKIRLGFDEKRETFLEIGNMCERLKVDALILHARYVKQGYSGKANWEKIKELKEQVNIPIVANGDITKKGHIHYLLERNYCDAVMIGREAKKNPSIFSDTKYSSAKQCQLFYTLYMQQAKKSLGQLQDHISWLVSGEKNAKEIKIKIRQAKSFEEIKKIIHSLNK